MKTAYEHINLISNVGAAERVFRAVWSGAAIVGVLSGAITAEGSIALAAMASIYLGMTAMVAVDPFYAAANALVRTTARRDAGYSWGQYRGMQAIPVRSNRLGLR